MIKKKITVEAELATEYQSSRFEAIRMAIEILADRLRRTHKKNKIIITYETNDV